MGFSTLMFSCMMHQTPVVSRHSMRSRRPPAVQLNGHGHETPEEQARRFGNLVGEAPQRIIIGGENPSAWAQGYVPHPTLSQRHLPVR